MKVSEKQLIMLTDIAKESLRISGLFGGYDLPIRIQLVNDLINQQSNALKEVDSVQPAWVDNKILDDLCGKPFDYPPEKPKFPPNIICKNDGFKYPNKK